MTIPERLSKFSPLFAPIVLLLALFLRVTLLLYSSGTNDITSWEEFARTTNADGICEAYKLSAEVNHPPAALLLSSLILSISSILGLSFTLVFRFVTSTVDFGSAGLVYYFAKHNAVIPAGWAATLFLLAPTTFLISTYHGNTDSILTFLILSSLIASIQKHSLFAGFFLGFALNVKVVAVFFLVALAMYEWRRGSRIQFISGLVPGFVLLMYEISPCWSLASNNIFSYVPIAERWGIALGLELLGMGHYFKFYRVIAGPLILLLILVTTYSIATRVSNHLPRIFFVCASLILVFAPGFGVQYLYWPLPFIIMVCGFGALIYIITSSLLLITAYIQFSSSIFPFASDHNGLFYRWTVAASILTFSSLLFLLLRSYRHLRQSMKRQ